MIRPTRSDDVPTLLEAARNTRVFRPAEIEVLEEVLGDYLHDPGGTGYHAYTYESDGKPNGFVIYGPNTMTDRTWDLYWIAVAPDSHRHGVGGELLRFAEDDMRKQNARLLRVETSSQPSYDPTRAFYKKHRYEQAAMLNDYYADGDSVIIFMKRL